ncbi:MAG: molybdopterin-guanine dinucleotide biosynthesis protein B [Candidatus Aminicenantes bacterium RBG_13_62_12]|nr:MAG: molybdopterin-guanine dinucleotide biosynthesis protein B [Candidatus Aminicenantes bacterium RBG_13_62_12]
MKIFGVVGSSESGKTRLIEKLVAEFKRRGRRTAVLKHCPHGFDLDVKGKDSARFFEAGAEGVGLASPDRAAFIHRRGGESDLALLAGEQFLRADIVFIEGGKGSRGYPKILVLAEGEPLGKDLGLEDVAAVVSAGKRAWNRRVFAPEEVSAMADFIERNESGPGSAASVTAEVDGADVPLNLFVQKVFEQVVLGLVTALKDIGPEPRRVVLTVTRSK